jgi:formiminoglutamase
MSGASSNAVAWFTRLEPAQPPTDLPRRPDDPRLGEIIEFWRGDPAALRPGRAVLIGFPQDEGVRRNGGRVGAAEAPGEIRRWLYRLTPGDPASACDLTQLPPLDAGNVPVSADLEQTQQSLGEVVAGVLARGGVPVVIGGGHETAYGVFLGYVFRGQRTGIINIDAHLDVRPLHGGAGHSGSPFRQALEHPTQLLEAYACLGLQPHATSREHVRYALSRGCDLHWHNDLQPGLVHHITAECDRMAVRDLAVHMSIDADAVSMAEVPGVSAPNPAGLAGSEVIAAARLAGCASEVTGLDLVEINPRHDRDGQSARWAALVLWNFLIGLMHRPQQRLEHP